MHSNPLSPALPIAMEATDAPPSQWLGSTGGTSDNGASGGADGGVAVSSPTAAGDAKRVVGVRVPGTAAYSNISAAMTAAAQQAADLCAKAEQQQQHPQGKGPMRCSKRTEALSTAVHLRRVHDKCLDTRPNMSSAKATVLERRRIISPHVVETRSKLEVKMPPPVQRSASGDIPVSAMNSPLAAFSNELVSPCASSAASFHDGSAGDLLPLSPTSPTSPWTRRGESSGGGGVLSPKRNGGGSRRRPISSHGGGGGGGTVGSPKLSLSPQKLRPQSREGMVLDKLSGEGVKGRVG